MDVCKSAWYALDNVTNSLFPFWIYGTALLQELFFLLFRGQQEEKINHMAGAMKEE